jgi:hypothetical protein
VVVTCELEHPAPGLAGVKVKAPRTTFWKLDGGQWCYYIDPKQGYQTPFGVMRPGPGQASNVPPSVASGTAPPAGVNTEALLSWIKPSKSELQLSSAKAGADEITLTNHGIDAATLIMQYADMPGLKLELDRREIDKGGSARLKAHWEPGKIPPPATIPVSILVQPTLQLVMVRVTFARE